MIKVKIWSEETDNFTNKSSISEEKTNKILLRRAINDSNINNKVNNVNKLNGNNNYDDKINNWIENIQNYKKNEENGDNNVSNNGNNNVSNNGDNNTNNKASPYKVIKFLTCINCGLELPRKEFSNIELSKIDNRKRCQNCQKNIQKMYRKKNEETIWENAIKMGHVIDGFCPETLREKFKSNGIWSEEYKIKCCQIQLSLELSGISGEKINENKNIDTIDDTMIIDNENTNPCKNYIYKSIPGVYEIPTEISDKLITKFGKKFKIAENIYKLFKPETLGV